jgi:hypothetical protein
MIGTTKKFSNSGVEPDTLGTLLSDEISLGRRNSDPGMSEPYFSDVFISSRVAVLFGNAAGIIDGDLVEPFEA